MYPINNYAWSKLGGECSVMLYKNSLILRTSVTEKPFIHKKAFYDFKTNFIFHEDLVSKIIKIKDKKGIFNIGYIEAKTSLKNFATGFCKILDMRFM